MKLAIETLPNCKTRIAVEIPPERVEQEKETIVKNYQRHARFPGFRPGKAPRNVVEKKFGKDIQDELMRSLVGDAARTAIKEHSLKVLTVHSVEDPVTKEDQSMAFEVEVITEPEFELPNYKGLPVTRVPETATDEEIDRVLENARQRMASYPEVTDRACQLEDYVVLDYFGTLDGQPLDVAIPDMPEKLVKDSQSWLRMVDDAFLPGFVQGVVGMAKDETREIDLSIPEDSPLEALRGKAPHYSVTLKEIHTMELPLLDDEFAKKVTDGKTLDELRAMVAENVAEEKKSQNDRRNQNEVVRQLIETVDFDLPEAMLKNEAQRALSGIVEENQSRGISDDELKEHHEEIMQGAQKSAKDRLKSTFLLLGIAKAENLEVSASDLNERIRMMSIRHRMPETKLRKELEKRDALDSIREELLAAKALELVIGNASVSEVAPEPEPVAEA